MRGTHGRSSTHIIPDNSDHDMVSAHAQREMSIAAVESVAAAAAGTK